MQLESLPRKRSQLHFCALKIDHVSKMKLCSFARSTFELHIVATSHRSKSAKLLLAQTPCIFLFFDALHTVA